ncbi:virulence protein RhuM/Fic/DOC family protein [Brumimicrobium mesophilum]|uniref:virulence protein RhuM/Fic/DOC family protein n=1 Tax=Brumimicrobium mesophilum TaxID=392717 RepID=UPI001F009F7A|nr:virulence protein RhuM/Fic/DOC family protein [Brumimicrobium mesophilum]
MNVPEIKHSEVVVFKPRGGQTEFQVVLDGEHDTVWATEQQIMELFGKARRTIGEHIKNIYKEGELDKESTWREFRQVQKEGDREVTRKVSIYNLDVIISVGYRVKSQVGTEFRKWATQRLKEYLLKGYSINQKLLSTEQQKVKALKQEINQLNEELFQTKKTLTDGILSIISHYSKSFELLEKYDKDELSSDNLNKDLIYVISYDDVKNAIKQLKTSLIAKGEASDLFGNEKDESFQGILGSISQTVFGELAYPTIEEQAVQLLYSIIKGHPFSDGNKRIGSFMFVWFLEKNGHHLNEKGERKVNDNTLVTLALAVAQSLPEQRETVQKLIMNLIKN